MTSPFITCFVVSPRTGNYPIISNIGREILTTLNSRSIIQGQIHGILGVRTPNTILLLVIPKLHVDGKDFHLPAYGTATFQSKMACTRGGSRGGLMGQDPPTLF